jgi:tetratricopeptide (TPR) repeat protein
MLCNRGYGDRVFVAGAGRQTVALRALGCGALGLIALLAGCATRTVAPPLPSTLPYPEYVYPAVPAAISTPDNAAQIDRGWRYLQNDDLSNAEREFTAVTAGSPDFYPAHTGAAYVALARRDEQQALGAFDTALRASSAYVPALVGRGLTLLAMQRDADAIGAFEAALAADASLTDVRRRLDVLRFRNLQNVIESARSAASAGRLPEARDAYVRAIAASPDSAFLHRELGLVERKQGNVDAALERFRRAVELDGSDPVSLTQVGELLEQRRDFENAAAAYRKAAELEPSPDLSARIAAADERAREARLPQEYQQIERAPQITRGDLAALVGVRLENVIRRARPREVVMTDVQGHWAAQWIAQVARAGVMDPYANHTFQPRERITRGDLAATVSALVMLLSAERADLRARAAERPQIADMAPGHLSYPAASVAVASGVLPLRDGRFQVADAVSGSEAVDAIARLRALAGPVL